MWLIIGLILGIILLSLATLWLRNKLIMDTIGFFGADGRMAGLHTYKKYGLWHLGKSAG